MNSVHYEPSFFFADAYQILVKKLWLLHSCMKSMIVSIHFLHEGIIVRVDAKSTKSFWCVFEICAN